MVHSKIGRLLAVVILVLSLAAACQVATPAGRKSQLKSKLGVNQKKQREIKHEIHIKQMEANDVTGQLSVVEQNLATTQSSLAQNTIKLLNAQGELQLTIERLDRTQKQLKRRQDLLERRVVDMYEGDDIQYVNVVLGSTDMWTFLTRAYYMQAILDSDTNLIKQIRADKAQIEADKKSQVVNLARIQNLQGRLESERNQVADLVDTKSQQLDQIEHRKDLLEKVLNELEAESNHIENEIQHYQQTPVGKKWLARKFTGGLSLPANGPITSTFGYRTHPITGVYKLHTGVDIGVHTGTPVHCAADGIVIKAGWYGAYGNAVIVDHGGGVQTLYGHCSRLCCSAGQSVKKGQVISMSGSTGYSTGPHLHFEKRVNGRPVNPL